MQRKTVKPQINVNQSEDIIYFIKEPSLPHNTYKDFSPRYYLRKSAETTACLSEE